MRGVVHLHKHDGRRGKSIGFGMDETADITSSDADRANSFGARFGTLVRSYREDLGISLSDLAIRVWGDETRKASLSRLENGRVHNPQAKTVQLVALALDIDHEEIDRLREPIATPRTDLAKQMGDLPQQSRDQLEALAVRFEISDAFKLTNDQLRTMLEEKAAEYRSYRERLMLLDDRQEEITIAKGSANVAADRMDFEQAEHHLQIADKLQTMLAVETKEVRAAHALMRGLVSDAYSIFVSAAESLREADLREMALRRDKYCQQMFRYGLKYGGNALQFALELQKPGVVALEDTAWRNEWAKVLSNQATIMASLAGQSKDARSKELLNDAIAAYKRLLEHYTVENMIEQCAMTQQNLAGALYQLSEKQSDFDERIKLLEESIDLVKQALTIRVEDEVPEEWAMTVQNLSVALRELGCLTGGERGKLFLHESADLARAALTVRTQTKDFYNWALTKENLAITEHALATHELTIDTTSRLSAAQNHIENVLNAIDKEEAPAVFARLKTLQNTFVDTGKKPSHAKLT